MKKIVLIFLMVMFFVQCKKDNASVQNTIEITDALGRKVKVPENITRIVAVNAGAMRFISYMEAIPLVVGIEETETRAKRPYNFAFPEIKKKTVIGPQPGGDAELIMKSNAQVIFWTASANTTPDDFQKKTGIPVVVIENGEFTPDLSKKYTVADMITGYGVAEAVKHFYGIYGGSVVGKKAIVQGFGNVGSAAAFYLAKMGAKVVGIIDRDGGVINENGFTFEEITELFRNKDGNKLVSDQMIPFAEINDKIWKIGAQIFAPCAASRIVSMDNVENMIASGLEVISCGANVPFADKEIFYGPIMEETDNKVSLIPDFISNCGMARVFAYFMEKKVQMTDEAIFNDASEIIGKAIQKTFDVNSSKTNISARAYEIALKQLV